MNRRRRVAAALLVAVVTAGGLRVGVCEPLSVGSDSMDPALRRGDTALVDKATLRLRPPRRREVVALRSPQDGAVLLKRIVGVGGDTVEIRDAVLVVNGREVPEPQVDMAADDADWFGPVTVPTGHVFVLGDNRANSVDSRSFGAVPGSAVVGRVWPPP